MRPVIILTLFVVGVTVADLYLSAKHQEDTGTIMRGDRHIRERRAAKTGPPKTTKQTTTPAKNNKQNGPAGQKKTESEAKKLGPLTYGMLMVIVLAVGALLSLFSVISLAALISIFNARLRRD